jgi:hypothetical protein
MRPSYDLRLVRSAIRQMSYFWLAVRPVERVCSGHLDSTWGP